MRIVTREEVRRSILGRQGLIAPFRDPHDAVRAMVAVQTQYAASLPVAVAARTASPRPGWDDAALAVGGSLVKSWSVRHTLHAHLPDDHALCVGTVGQRAYARYQGWMMARRGFDLESVTKMEARVEEALSNGPLTREQLHERLPELRAIDMVGWGLDVMGLAFRGRLCVVGRGGAQSFALLDPPVSRCDLAGLLRRYFEAFGPATLNDFSHWSGLPISAFRDAVANAGPLERLQIDGLKGERLAIPGTLDQLEPGLLGVRLLAKFDPLVLAHKDKSLFIAAEDRSRVFRKAGQVEAVVLSEGRACATWRLERRGARALFSVEPFRGMKTREKARLEKEAALMARSLGLEYGGMGYASA